MAKNEKLENYLFQNTELDNVIDLTDRLRNADSGKEKERIQQNLDEIVFASRVFTKEIGGNHIERMKNYAFSHIPLIRSYRNLI
jgi:hypothetical protein